VKTILFFVAIIAAVAYFGYKYVLEEEDCPRSPVTNQCMGTTTGYPAGGGGTGGGGGGAPIQVTID
jgi:hypothetical protein